MKIKEGDFCTYQIDYHFVFPVKSSKALASDEVKQEIRKICEQLEEKFFVQIKKIGSDPKNIHLLCSMHPKYAPRQIVKSFKDSFKNQLTQKIAEEKQEEEAITILTSGYCVATSGKTGNWNIIENYLDNQIENLEELELITL